MASARIVSTYWVFSQTSDEPAHLACGMEYLDRGVYRYEAQHPPLSRIAAAIGPYLIGARSQAAEGRSMYHDGLAILHAGGRYDDTLAAARAGILPFFWVACAVVYLWARRDLGPGPAVVALFVFTMLPPALAHAGFATTDMALTAFLGAAFLAGREWIERPSAKTALWFGAAGGLALLSKFSSVVFFPAAAVLAIGWCLSASPEARAGLGRATVARMPTFATAAGVAALVVWAGYRFSFGPVHPGGVSVPAPELFRGVGEVLTHNREGHDSYLLGEYSKSGFWHFYFVVLAVKTPIAALALAIAGAAIAIRTRSPRFAPRLPAAFAAAVLLVGMASSINIGVRHVLPVYIGMSILAAAAVWRALDAGGWKPKAVAALAAWLAIGSLLSHPDYLPYFNELAGAEPERVLVDSDLDWGQDIKRLTTRLREVGASYVSITPAFGVDLGRELPPNQNSNATTPYVGWNAVSVTRWKLYNFDLPRDSKIRPWPERVPPPRERVGKGILLWYFPPSTGLPVTIP